MSIAGTTLSKVPPPHHTTPRDVILWSRQFFLSNAKLSLHNNLGQKVSQDDCIPTKTLLWIQNSPCMRLNFVNFQSHSTSLGSWVTRQPVGVAADLCSIINQPMNTAKHSRELKYLANKTLISPSPPCVKSFTHWADTSVMAKHLCAWLQTEWNHSRLWVAML